MAFQLVVVGMMVAAAVVLAVADACKTFAVHTEAEDICAASVAVESHCNLEQVLAFDLPFSEPVLLN